MGYSCWIRPQHLAVHPTAPYAYLVCEEANVLVTLQLDRATGIISSGKEELVYHSTLDKDGLGCFGKEESMCLAKCSSMLMRLIFTSLTETSASIRPRSPAEVQNNRSRCSIAVFAVKAGGAQVDLIQSIASAGTSPRHGLNGR